MAENEGGIHPAVMNQLMDLHRKHSELQMQLHDKQTEKGEGEDASHQITVALHSAVTELTSTIKQLIVAVKEDVKADLAQARADKSENGSGKRKQP